MPLNAYETSVAVFAPGLTNLKSVLMKGEAYASANGIDPVELINAQLADGMYNLGVQVHWAGEGARLAVARLVGVETTPLAAEEAKSFDKLYERLDATVG